MDSSQPVRRWATSNLGSLGFVLALLVALIHLFHPQRGLFRLVLLVRSGNASLLVTDPRPVAFVLSAIAILLGIQLVVADVARKRVYLLGMALMATYFVGYFTWHLSGHGGFLPGRKPLYHGLHPLEAVVSHLVDSSLAAVAKLAEATLFIVLSALYRRESYERQR
ncbi:MAG: hypothetical protein V5A38_13400 [Halolamina sp.]|uniref:hypothetical protein n=1 Tax=Halolamina sp. TaxID=1940283 RepID=UPI002FC2E404